MTDNLFGGGRRSINLFEGSRTSPVRPSDRSIIKMKTSEQRKAVAGNKVGGILN